MKNNIQLKAIILLIAIIGCIMFGNVTASANTLKSIDGLMYLYSNSGENLGKYSGFTNSSAGRRCYKNGILMTNKHFRTSKGVRYCTDKYGYLIKGWKKFKDGWHWFDEIGVEALGDTKIFGAEAFFSENGVFKFYYSSQQIDRLLDDTVPKEYYGGFKENLDTLIIKSTDVDAIKPFIPNIYPIIEIIECKFTYKQLEDTEATILQNINHFRGYHLNVTVDMESNKVYVGTSKVTNKLLNFISSLEYAECVTIIQDDLSDPE